MIEFTILGPIEALRDGALVDLGGRRQRALLALLIVRHGQVIDSERLIEELWSGAPPAGASITLRSYVSRLRRALGTTATIAGTSSGYRLTVEPDTIDGVRFEGLLQTAQEAVRRNERTRAATDFSAALALWRGRPFGDLSDEGLLHSEADRLEELREHAIEERIEVELSLGRAAELVDELTRLVSEHPYRERLWRQLMLALYRSERQADALAAYQRARTMLDEEMGLEPSEELQALQLAILRHDVPPASPPEARHNLPAPLTAFVGRAAELEELAGIVHGERLVTLTGVGGVGKTRLAIEVARRELGAGEFGDGIHLVDLSPVVEPTLVEAQLARVLEVREQGDRQLSELMAARLRDARVLLVLDNCEHLVDAVGGLAAELLASCPQLHVLATSRVLLGIAGEVAYAVPPLNTSPFESSGASEAAELFLARAGAANVHLLSDLDGDEQLTAAERICAELDGLPLAIELAAARARALSLDEIADRLADRFRFLVSWRRLTAARHQTLREAMDWSYDLLGPSEQSLLAGLSVFVGGFTLAAASEVCLGGDEDTALQLIEALVDASLVVPQQAAATTRYYLLETVRQYAAGRLDSGTAGETTRQRHADYFLAMAEAAWVPIRGEAQAATAARLAADQDNLRATLAWYAAREDRSKLLRVAEALWWFWWLHGDATEGRAWLSAALDESDDLDVGLRARAFQGAAGLAWARGDLDAAQRYAEAGRALYAGLEMLELPFGSTSGKLGESACVNTLGLIALDRGDLPSAKALFTQYLEISRSLTQDKWTAQSVAIAHHNLASVAVEENDLQLARTLYTQSLDDYLTAGEQEGSAMAELYLGLTEIYAGRAPAGAARLRRALLTYRRIGFLQYLVECLEGAALVAALRDDDSSAATLLAAAWTVRSRSGTSATGRLARTVTETTAGVEQRLGEVEFGRHWQAGAEMTLDEASQRAEAVLSA